MFGEVENLIEKELVRQPYYVNFVMGVGGMGGYPGTPRNLIASPEDARAILAI